MVDPSPNRTDKYAKINKHYHDVGLRAGDTSLLGVIYQQLLEAVADESETWLEDFQVDAITAKNLK